MPIVEDVLRGLQIQIDALWYNLLFSLAGMHWSIQRAFLMLGYTVELVNQWLVETAFMPLIAQTNASLQVAVGAAFMIALLVLGITYLLAAFVRVRVVDPKSAIAWYLAGALFFSLGPQLYQGLSAARRDVSQAFYASALSGLQSSTGSTFSSLSSVSNTELGLIPLCDNFGSYLPTWNYGVDGLDVALSYLRADAIDLLGYPSTPRDPRCQPHTPDPNTGTWTAGVLPWEWLRPGSFFANDRQAVLFTFLTDQERAASISMGSAAHGRLLTAWPLILLGVSEQLVYLLLTVAQGLTFLSFGVAILFAFFKKTEVIARSIIDLWIELIVQTIVIALLQALVVTFFLTGTASGSGVVVLGIGLLCLIFMVIVLFSGIKAVWNAFNRLFNAFGQATGGAVMSPGAAALVTAAGAAGGVGLTAGLTAAAVGGTVSVGSNALAGATALRSGATPAQAAGLTFGGSAPLADAARTLTRLPSLRGTALGSAAEQFTEGAVTRQVAREIPIIGRMAGPTLGMRLLTDYDPAKAEYDKQGRVVRRPMLVPAVGERLEALIYPPGKQPSLEAEAAFTPVAPKRMGTFTPIGGSETAERGTAADDLRGEELEQHLTDTLDRTTGTLAGNLKLTGSADVLGVLADVLRLLGGRGANGVDHLTTADLIAQAVGVTARDGQPPVRDDLTRFGLFVDSAARLGLSPVQAEQVGREVRESPDRTFSSETRTTLITQAVQAGSSRDEADRAVYRLEVAARLLPTVLTVEGTIHVPEAGQSLDTSSPALAGSEILT